MSGRRYHINRTADGGFAVQVVEDGTEDFSSYHRRRTEAEAAMAAEIVRDAAPDLLAACEAASAELHRAPDEANTFDGYTRISNAVSILAAAIAKAKGGTP